MDERKQVEIALRESEERFRNIFETTLNCIFIKDKNLRFTQVNPAMLNKLGASGTEILGKTDKDVFSAAYAKQSRWVETKALQGETVETQQNLQVGGQMCIFNIIRSPLKDALGRIIGVFGVARDLTEREFGRSQFKLSPDQYVSKAMRNALYQTYLAAKSESPVLF
ncbi:MAG: PAS domain-containing protein, partial [Desulfomonilaceae bacterium]